MIAEARNAAATNDASPALEQVEIEVEVTNSPTGPTFKFYGLGPNRSIYVEASEAFFVLTLSPIGFPGPVTFAPINPDTDGPLSWFTPGSGVPVVRPAYISAPILSSGGTVVSFTDTNTASSGLHDLVDFAVNIEVAGTDSALTPHTSHDPYTSPDPTIINVDPTGPPHV